MYEGVEMYTIKLFEKPLIDFEIEDTAEGQTPRIVRFYEENRNYFPYKLLKPTVRSINLWLRKRVITRNVMPDNENWLKSHFNISYYDTRTMVDQSRCLSLNDCYWVSKSPEEDFADFNLFDHTFDFPLAIGRFIDNGIRRGLTKEDGKIYFYKGGNNETWSEVYGTQLCHAFDLPCVEYTLEEYDGVICSKCAFFGDINHSYATINFFMAYPSLNRVGNRLKEFKEEYYDLYSDMLVLDSLMANNDRHFGNFGLIVDSRELTPLSFAPIFDNGRSFYPTTDLASADDMLEASKHEENFFGVSLDEVAVRFMNDRNREKLRSVQSFHFSDNGKHHLPEERTKMVEEYIHKRAEYLLNLK